MRPLIKQAVFLGAFAFACGFFQHIPAAAAGTMQYNTARVLSELSQSISTMQIDPAAANSEGGYKVSFRALANSFSFSHGTREWVSSDTLTVRAKNAVLRGYPLNRGTEETRYIITVQLNSGWKCAFADDLFLKFGGNMSLYVCKSPKGSLVWLRVDP